MPAISDRNLAAWAVPILAKAGLPDWVRERES